MKYFLLSLFLFSFIQAENNNVNYKILSTKQNWNIHKRIYWTNSFMCSYISKNNNKYNIKVYNHKSKLNKIYDIASITKTFTALCILELHNEKKINIDNSVCEYIQYYDANVTIRNFRYESNEAIKIRAITNDVTNIKIIEINATVTNY